MTASRKKRSEKRLRQHLIGVRVSPAELELIEAEARRTGIKPAGLLRAAFFAGSEQIASSGRTSLMYKGTTARSPRSMIEVAVLVRGIPQPLYEGHGGKLYVAGTPGEQYELQVRNLTSRRAEVLCSVDARNLNKDEPADRHQNQGTVFSGHASGTLKGFRLSDAESLELRFGAPGRSVAAAATGSTRNVGVIGFAVYGERNGYYGTQHLGGYDDFGVNYRGGGMMKGVTFGSNADSDAVAEAAEAPVAMASAGVGGLGTEAGARQRDVVWRTQFEREAGEPDVLAIFYDSQAVLDSLGVTDPPDPDPFPGIGTGYEKYASR